MSRFRRGASPGRKRVPLEMVSRQVGDVVVVRCRGRIVAGPDSQSLQDCVRELIPDTRAVVLDLSDVAFVDSSGLGMLVRLHSSARAAGGGLRLCALSPTLRQVLQFTNLHQLFEIHENESDAVSSYYRSPRAATGGGTGGPRLLCVDSSHDVLAYVRELVHGAGYQTLTSNNLPDALLLIKAAAPDMVLLGPLADTERNQAIKETMRHSGLPLLEMEADFFGQDAGSAGPRLLDAIRARLGSRSA